MKERICIYKKKIYRNVRYKDNFVELIVHEKVDETYEPYKDVEGKVMNGLYYKWVSEDELEDLYIIECSAVYKGIVVDPSGLHLGKKLLKDNKILIYTRDTSVANQYNFKRCDKWEYEKTIQLTEVDNLIVNKKYLLGEEKGKIITWEMDIISFLENYPDNI